MSPRTDDLASSQTRSYLLPLSLEEDNQPLKAEPARGGGRTKMKKSASMLEVDAIHDMLEFCEAMDAVSGETSPAAESPKSKSTAAGDDKHEDAAGFYIDSSDRSENEKPPLPPSSSGRRSSRGSGTSRGLSKSWSSSRMNDPDLLSIVRQDPRPLGTAGVRDAPKSRIKPRSSSLSSTASGKDAPLRSSFRSASSGQDGAGRRMPRNVSFSSLEIRTYGITLGDAPTPHGPPVSLDWDYDAEEEVDIDAYEAYRAEEAPRRNQKEMVMSPWNRQYLLMNGAGFSRGAIRAVSEEARRVARQREKTARWEKMKRKLSFKSSNFL